MPVGFPAYHEEFARYDCSPRELKEAIEDALDELDWSGSRSKRRQWTATTGMSLFSWGEKVIIDIEQDGGVSVRSEYAFPLAWLDWGHNRTNVRRFLKQLDRFLGDREDEPEDF